MRTFDERPGYRANHLKRDGGSDWDRGWLWQWPRLCRMARTGAQANLDRRSHDPRQDIEARQPLPPRPVRTGRMGRSCKGQARSMGGSWAKAMDRSRQEAAAPQRAGGRACQKLARIAWSVLARGRVFEASKLKAT